MTYQIAARICKFEWQDDFALPYLIYIYHICFLSGSGKAADNELQDVEDQELED